jgi:hypothetical protein
VAASLSSFLTYATVSGLIAKWCKQFHLKYPVVPVDAPVRTNPVVKKRKALKYLVRLLLLSPEYAEARAKVEDLDQTLKGHLRSLFDNSLNSAERVARLQQALNRPDVIDHELFLRYADLMLSYVSGIMTEEYVKTKEWTAAIKEGLGPGDNTWFDYITYEKAPETAPLVTYSKGTVYINSTIAMQKVRAGNNKKAFIDEIVKISKLIVRIVLDSESGKPVNSTLVVDGFVQCLSLSRR